MLGWKVFKATNIHFSLQFTTTSATWSLPHHFYLLGKSGGAAIAGWLKSKWANLFGIRLRRMRLKSIIECLLVWSLGFYQCFFAVSNEAEKHWGSIKSFGLSVGLGMIRMICSPQRMLNAEVRAHELQDFVSRFRLNGFAAFTRDSRGCGSLYHRYMSEIRLPHRKRRVSFWPHILNGSRVSIKPFMLYWSMAGKWSFIFRRSNSTISKILVPHILKPKEGCTIFLIHNHIFC